MKKSFIPAVLLLAMTFFVSCGLVDEEDLEDYGDYVDSESGSNNDPTSDTSDNSDQENDQENDNGDTGTDQASENGDNGTDQGNENGDTGTDPNPNPTPDPTDPGDNNGNQGGETPGNDTEIPDQENETPDQDTETPDSDTGSGDNGNETFDDENDTYDYEKCTEITLDTDLEYDDNVDFGNFIGNISCEVYYTYYTPRTGTNSKKKDSLNIEFYALDDLNGTYNLRGKNYSSKSGLFLVVYEDSGAKKYIQRKGKVVVSGYNSSTLALTAELTDVALEEVTIDKNTNETTAVPDGACITIVDTTLTF